MASAKNHLLAV